MHQKYEYIHEKLIFLETIKGMTNLKNEFGHFLI